MSASRIFPFFIIRIYFQTAVSTASDVNQKQVKKQTCTTGSVSARSAQLIFVISGGGDGTGEGTKFSDSSIL